MCRHFTHKWCLQAEKKFKKNLCVWSFTLFDLCGEDVRNILQVPVRYICGGFRKECIHNDCDHVTNEETSQFTGYLIVNNPLSSCCVKAIFNMEYKGVVGLECRRMSIKRHDRMLQSQTAYIHKQGRKYKTPGLKDVSDTQFCPCGYANNGYSSEEEEFLDY